MTDSIMFPLSSEEFAAYQEYLIGRLLNENEKELLDAWIPIINDAYEDGLNHDTDSILSCLAVIDSFADRYKLAPAIKKFLTSALDWIVHAWRQGLADSSK